MALFRVKIVAILLLSFSTLASGLNIKKSPVDSIADNRRFDYFYMQALFLKEQGDYASAFDMFEHCLAINPQSPIVLSELSSLYQYLGRNDEAIEKMRSAISIEPGNYWYYQALAIYYHQKGAVEESAGVYKEMVERFPTHSELYIALAALYEESGDYEKSVDALNKLERREGKSEGLSLQKYSLYMTMRDMRRAIAEINALIAEHPEDMRYRLTVGDTYMRFGENDSALAMYQSVAALEPNNIMAQYSIAECYNIKGNDSLYTLGMEQLLRNEKLEGELRTRALVEFVQNRERRNNGAYIYSFFEELMQLPYGQAETADVLANYMIMKEVGEDSVAPVLKKLLHYEPDNRTALMQSLIYAINRKDYNEVIARCDTAILYYPEILSLYYYRGLAHYKMNRVADAVTSYKQGIECRSEDTDPKLLSDVYTLLGDTYHELGSMEACYAAYDSALVYDDSNISVLNNYAYFLSLERRDLDRALEMSYRTILAEPDEPTYLDTYAWILFELGRYSEAKAYIEKLLSLKDYKLSAEVCTHIGDIYAKCGETDTAVEFWKRAQSLGDESKILKRKIKKRRYISNVRK